jgi:hypothetical protein
MAMSSSVFSQQAWDDAVPYGSTSGLPQSTLGYGTNTRYPDFPPKMADGRSLLSTWQPESVANAAILREQGITSNWEYRKYLTHNASSIMAQNFRESCNDTGYTVIPQGADTGTREPFSSISDMKQPFGLHNSDLKSSYLTREQLQSRRVAPVMTQAELISMSR